MEATLANGCTPLTSDKLGHASQARELRRIHALQELEQFEQYIEHLTKYDSCYKCSDTWELVRVLKTQDILALASTTTLGRGQELQEQEHLLKRASLAFYQFEQLGCHGSLCRLKDWLRRALQWEMSHQYDYEEEPESSLIFKRFDRLLGSISNHTFMALLRRFYKEEQADTKAFRAYERWRRALKPIIDDYDFLWDYLDDGFNHKRPFLNI